MEDTSSNKTSLLFGAILEPGISSETVRNRFTLGCNLENNKEKWETSIVLNVQNSFEKAGKSESCLRAINFLSSKEAGSAIICEGLGLNEEAIASVREKKGVIFEKEKVGFSVRREDDNYVGGSGYSGFEGFKASFTAKRGLKELSSLQKLEKGLKRGFEFSADSCISKDSWSCIKQHMAVGDQSSKFEQIVNWIAPIENSEICMLVRPTRFKNFLESIFGDISTLSTMLHYLVEELTHEISYADSKLLDNKLSQIYANSKFSKIIFFKKNRKYFN